MGSFFAPSIILLFTTQGFIVHRLPFLNKIPIGGRLKLCTDSWKKVSSSSWVLNVVSEGYKIPSKYVPVQCKIPSNPPSTGAAYNVLVEEAKALHLKLAIAPAKPIEGQYISSYFAVPKARSPGNFAPCLI